MVVFLRLVHVKHSAQIANDTLSIIYHPNSLYLAYLHMVHSSYKSIWEN